MDREMHAPFGANPTALTAWCRGHKALCALLVALGTLVCLLGVGWGFLYMADHNGFAQERDNSVTSTAGDLLANLGLFKDWGRPAFVLVLSGEQHGYMQPCGCSEPQYGGLVRRYNLIQAIRQRGWPIVAADLGDINQTEGPQKIRNDQQAMLKYTYSMRAIDMMGYSAVNFGNYEMSLALLNVLAHYALNNPTPRVVSANLLGRLPGQPFNATVFESALVDKPQAPKVGILGLTGPSVESKVKDPGIKFDRNTPEVLLEGLRKMKKDKAELVVLLYQGDKEHAAGCAKYCADKMHKDPTLARLDVILCLSDEPDPPALPIPGPGGTMIVQVGHKGKFVGVVGAFRSTGLTPFELKYQLVSLEPKLATPEAEVKTNKLMQLIEEYAKEVKDGDYLGMYKQTKHHVQVLFPNADYVGSAACKNCHPDAFKVWEKSKHANAYETLVKAENPGLRQFDGECIVCHTVGFSKITGFANLQKTPNLTDVGCESCHGPCSEHLRKPNQANIHLAINPYKFRGAQPEGAAAQHKRQLDLGDQCQKCHDLDNDTHFDFDKYWPKIMHMTAQLQPLKK